MRRTNPPTPRRPSPATASSAAGLPLPLPFAVALPLPFVPAACTDIGARRLAASPFAGASAEASRSSNPVAMTVTRTAVRTASLVTMP